MNVKEAIDYIAEAWNNVTPTTIQNCWLKTGILPSYNEFIDEDIDYEEDDTDTVSKRKKKLKFFLVIYQKLKKKCVNIFKHLIKIFLLK